MSNRNRPRYGYRQPDLYYPPLTDPNFETSAGPLDPRTDSGPGDALFEGVNAGEWEELTGMSEPGG